MWNIKFILYLLILVLITAYIGIKKPEMHKQFVVTDSNFEFVDVDTKIEDTSKIENTGNIKDTTFVNKPVKPVNHDIKVGGDFKNNNIKFKNTDTKLKQTAQPKPQPQPKPTAQPTTTPKPVAQTPPQTQPPKQQEVKPTPTTETKPVLTEQEEIIAWNHWRSRLQNQVMMDSKISAPLGTQFKFTFTVDKYGNMSNVKVWSTNPSYSDLAVRVIKPVLMSYRNKPILNFPYGTRRIITNVEGGFVISRVSRYSSPSDYNDYEHVKTRH